LLFWSYTLHTSMMLIDPVIEVSPAKQHVALSQASQDIL
jgi:hypothetical protein